jgi:hypothetical protein
MRPDIRKKYLKHIHKSVDELYCNKFMTITAACKKIGVSPSVYYAACGKLKKNSVNYSKPIEKTQEGGSKNVEKKKSPKNEEIRRVTKKKETTLDKEDAETDENGRRNKKQLY